MGSLLFLIGAILSLRGLRKTPGPAPSMM